MNMVVLVDTCAVINFMHIDRFLLFEHLRYTPLTTVFVRLEFEHGRAESRAYFHALLVRNKLTLAPLEIGDLVRMASIPRSKRASDAELSCFVLAQRYGCKAMTDDEKAIKFASSYLGFAPKDVLRLVDLLLAAYEAYILGDSDLRSLQATLAANRFRIGTDLCAEAARRRLMSARGWASDSA